MPDEEIVKVEMSIGTKSLYELYKTKLEFFYKNVKTGYMKLITPIYFILIEAVA